MTSSIANFVVLRRSRRICSLIIRQNRFFAEFILSETEGLRTTGALS
jgi:hypothetical protein